MGRQGIPPRRRGAKNDIFIHRLPPLILKKFPKWGTAGRREAMARPSKPAAVIEYEKKSHRTKAELAKRKEEERKLLTGQEIKERKEVKGNKDAHREFLRLRKLLRSIGKDDALYEPVINRYAMLQAECRDFEEKREVFLRNMQDLQEKREELLEGGDVSLKEYFRMQNEFARRLVDLDRQVQGKRKMLLEVEKENVMTIASALRNIPKKAEEGEDPLIRALKGGG
jgi:hypothetical protein